MCEWESLYGHGYVSEGNSRVHKRPLHCPRAEVTDSYELSVMGAGN